MAVVAVTDFKGANISQYDAMNRELGVSRIVAEVPGLIVHTVVTTPDGFRVIGIWESEEAFRTYRTERVEPLAPKVGGVPPTSIEVFPVHHMVK